MNAKQRRKMRRASWFGSVWGRGAWCGICGETIEDPDEVHGETKIDGGEIVFTCKRTRMFHPRPAAVAIIQP